MWFAIRVSKVESANGRLSAEACWTRTSTDGNFSLTAERSATMAGEKSVNVRDFGFGNGVSCCCCSAELEVELEVEVDVDAGGSNHSCPVPAPTSRTSRSASGIRARAH